MPREFATITFIGQDQAGVIARLTQLLFQLGANIEALEEQVTRGQFSMTLQASWPTASFDRETILRRVDNEGRDLKMETRVHFTPPGPPRLAILVTRESHVLAGLLAKSPKALGAQPVIVIGSRPDLAPMAKKALLPFVHVPFIDRAESEKQVLALLDERQVNFVVLAPS